MLKIRSASLPQRLLLLALAGLLPVVLLAGTALVLLARKQSDEIQDASIQTMRAMTGAVDGELKRSIAVLEALATAESLQQDDLTRFAGVAERVWEAQSGWTTIILADPAGTQRINANQALGAAALHTGDAESFARVVRSARPAVGAVVPDPPRDAYVFAVHVPVIRDNELRYVLTAAIRPQSMLGVIERQKLPADGLVGIFDQHRNIVARSFAHETFVGRPVAPEFRELLAVAPEGWGRTRTLEDQPVYTAYGLSDFSRWGVGIGIPRASIDGPLLRSSLFLAAGILISLALGGIGATLVARGIAGPIQALRAAARAVGRGEKPAPIASTIPEVRDVAEALAAAAEDRNRMETAREEMLRLEREARALAEGANRMKDQFLAMFGHELRNPLAAIKSAVELLVLPAAQEDVRNMAHAVLKRQVDHLNRLINDLLDVQRVMTGKIVIERSAVELSEALAHALAALRSTGDLDQHQVSVRTEPVWIEGDATRIEQILANLLVNAAKHTPHGRRITITLAREGTVAVLTVRDEGIGIEAHLLPRIFDLFVQGDTPLHRARGGFGLGLTLVRRLVELHGGIVSAESEGPGKGSVFTVRLPVPESRARVAAAEPRARAPARRRNVLVVEDNDDARIMMRHTLELRGHRVWEAGDGPAGVEAAIRLRPDVAFIDLGLPKLDGYEVARRVRAAVGAGMRLVALTGYGAADDRRRSYEAGFNVHQVKPIDPESLERVLADIPDDPPPPGGLQRRAALHG